MATTATEAIETSAAEFPSSLAIAVRSAPAVELQSPGDIQRAMQQFDGEQFLAEIMGEALEKWFYSFRVSGKEVEGVSAAGAHEFARLRADQGFPIRFPLDGVRLEETSENGESGVRATIVARDHRSGMEAIGMAFYPYYTERRDGTREFDRMASRKAMSVAERNGILRLIPEKTVISALKVRAQIVAANESRRQEESRAALAGRPVAARITAGSERTGDDGYAAQPAIASTTAKPADKVQHPEGGPACPVCGGAMWDNRANKRNPRSPDFKCRNAPAARGEPGCEGVIWPPKEGEARDETGTRRPDSGELALGAERGAPTPRRNAVAEGR